MSAAVGAAVAAFDRHWIGACRCRIVFNGDFGSKACRLNGKTARLAQAIRDAEASEIEAG